MLHPTTTNAPSDNVREKGGVKIPQVATKSDSDKEIEDLSYMAHYILDNKRIPVIVERSADALKEVLPKCFMPSETSCPRCSNELHERKLPKPAKIYSTTTDCTPVPIYVKDCTQCGLTVDFRDYQSSWINRDNFHVCSAKLLELILSRQKSHTSLIDVLESLKRDFGVVLNHDIMYEMMGYYLSMKGINFEMVCGICGPEPPLLCYDSTRKVTFKIPKSHAKSHSKKEGYVNYKEFYLAVCIVDVVKALTPRQDLREKFELDIGNDWLPFIGSETVVDDPQPRSSRIDKSDVPVAKTPFPIKHDVLEDLKTGGNSKITLKKLCSELGIKTSGMKKSDMINAIVASNYSYDEFASKFFKLGGRSGGCARAFCEHGCVYTVHPQSFAWS